MQGKAAIKKQQIKQMEEAYVAFKKTLDGLYVKRTAVVAEIRKRQNNSKIELLLAKLKQM